MTVFDDLEDFDNGGESSHTLKLLFLCFYEDNICMQWSEVERPAPRLDIITFLGNQVSTLYRDPIRKTVNRLIKSNLGIAKKHKIFH